ncbi:MAG: AAA family ATPase, partial [Longimicrobiales bacterium]
MRNLPLVEREPALKELRTHLEAAAEGSGGVVFVSGEAGVGKTRLLRDFLEHAKRQQRVTALGRAYAVETGVPYSLIADALLPVFSRMPEQTRTILTRGAEAELLHVFPMLAGTLGKPRTPAPDLPDFKNRLLWTFTEVLRALCTHEPVLV